MEFSLVIKSENGNKFYEFIYHENDNYVWLRNGEGESMGMNKQQFFEHVDKWFKENL